MRPLKFLCLFVLSMTIAKTFSVSPLSAQQTANKRAAATGLTNDDIIGLANAGLAEDVIISKIQKAPTTSFDTSVAGLKSLKASGVSSAVIKVMLDPSAPIAPPPLAPMPVVASAPTPNDPDDPDSRHTGLFIQLKGDDGKLHMTKLLMTTISDMKKPGLGSMLATSYSFGIHKSKMKMVVAGAKSQMETTDSTPVFYDYAGDMSINNLTLIHFEVKGDTRMVTSMSVGSIFTGGVKSGPGDEKQEFSAELVKPGVYRLTFTNPLAPGAYAFGNMMMGQMSTFYDFDILPPQ